MDGTAMARRMRAIAVTASALPVTLDKDTTAELLAATAQLADGLSREARLELATLEMLSPVQLAGRTVAVDAAAVLAFVRLHGLLGDQQRGEVARLCGELQASKQTSLQL
ncbi:MULTISPECIES: hypothetical protein [Cupriavidus]